MILDIIGDLMPFIWLNDATSLRFATLECWLGFGELSLHGRKFQL